jgi:hypothetical protein
VTICFIPRTSQLPTAQTCSLEHRELCHRINPQITPITTSLQVESRSSGRATGDSELIPFDDCIMSSDLLGSTQSSAFPSATSSTVSSPRLRHRSGFELSSDVGDLPRQDNQLDPNHASFSNIPEPKPASGSDSKRPDGLTREASTDSTNSLLKGTTNLGRNVIEGLQLDSLRERMSKLPKMMEMPEIKMPTPNLDVDVQ